MVKVMVKVGHGQGRTGSDTTVYGCLLECGVLTLKQNTRNYDR